MGGGKLGQDATMEEGGRGRKRTSRKAETFSADKNLKMAEASVTGYQKENCKDAPPIAAHYRFVLPSK